MTTVDFHAATGYDLFVSLFVLHEPARYGLRGAWAAGIRARIPEAERNFLARLVPFFLPVSWIHTLPAPRDAATVLSALADLPAAARLETLFSIDEVDKVGVFQFIGSRGRWDKADLDQAAQLFALKPAQARRKLAPFLESWARPAESGDLLLAALRAYFAAFYAEEEKRIHPWLERAVERAQALAEELPLPALLEQLSDGVHFDLPLPARLTIAPSFWSTPLVVPSFVTPDHVLYLFGARPAHVSLVPGEPVPDDLLRALKALSDPTRLRILRYLQQAPHNPSALARLLRLRAPTVIHHLDALRLARLVQVTMADEGRRVYMLRADAIDKLAASLHEFLGTAEE